MIYVKRFVWMLGWVPVFIGGLILCLISMFLCPLIGLFYYIKYGDVEITPDKFLPMYSTIWLTDAYKKLEPKL